VLDASLFTRQNNFFFHVVTCHIQQQTDSFKYPLTVHEFKLCCKFNIGCYCKDQDHQL